MNTAYQRALIFVQLSRYSDAEHSLRTALALDADDARSHAMLAVCLVPQGKFKAARDSAQFAIAKEPDLAFAHYALAVTLLRDTKSESLADASAAGDMPDRLALSERSIRFAIRLDPENANYHSLLATVLLDRGDGERAVDEARIALAFDSDQADALKIIGVAAGYLGLSEKEISMSVESITTNPTDAMDQAVYGAALLRGGQRSRAMPLLKKAIEREPDHPYIRRQYLQCARSANRIHALGLRARHNSEIVANPYAAFYSVTLTLLIGIGFALALYVSQKLGINDSRELIVLAGAMLPAYVLVALRPWIDFRLQFDPKAARLMTRSERLQANIVAWAGTAIVVAQAIPIGKVVGHASAGLWIFTTLELAATVYFIRLARRPINPPA